MDKIAIFHHNYLINNWREVIGNQLLELKNSGLYQDATIIIASVYSPNPQEYQEFRNLINTEDFLYKWQIIEQIDNGSEADCLKLLYDYCQRNDTNVLYFHSKGVSHPGNNNVKSWVDYLMYFNINKYKDALNSLQEYDTYGVDYDLFDAMTYYNFTPETFDRNGTYYAGNFWWATSNHIKKLNKNNLYTNNRFDAEAWLYHPEIKAFNAHTSHNNFYLFPYDKKYYTVDIPSSILCIRELNEDIELISIGFDYSSFVSEYIDVKSSKFLSDLSLIIDEKSKANVIIIENISFESIKSLVLIKEHLQENGVIIINNSDNDFRECCKVDRDLLYITALEKSCIFKKTTNINFDKYLNIYVSNDVIYLQPNIEIDNAVISILNNEGNVVYQNDICVLCYLYWFQLYDTSVLTDFSVVLTKSDYTIAKVSIKN